MTTTLARLRLHLVGVRGNSSAPACAPNLSARFGEGLPTLLAFIRAREAEGGTSDPLRPRQGTANLLNREAAGLIVSALR